MSLFTKRFEGTDRSILLWLRWLFFIVLTFLFLYSYREGATFQEVAIGMLLIGLYALSNLILTWVSRASFSLERWGMPLFILDIILVGLILYRSVGSETDFYIMCFAVVYLSMMSRRVRDAIPSALATCLIYGLLLRYRNPGIDLMDSRILLRFAFFLVLALFSSYLSEQVERGRRRIRNMQEVQALLAGELDKAKAELEEKQAALVQAEKLSAMGTMAGALAHEIRNPLSVIIGYTEDLLSGLETNAPLRKPLDAVRRSAQRCRDLMENLLRFSRRPREVETFDLKETVEQTIGLAQMALHALPIQFATDFRSTPQFSGHRSEIQQVFLNFITNAADAMPKGGTLTIRVDEKTELGKNWIEISFQDTGAGIPEEIRDRIFDSFFTTKAPGKGTGLGLSIVRDIVRSYGGVLSVESKVDVGTTMIVRLPATPVPQPVS